MKNMGRDVSADFASLHDIAEPVGMRTPAQLLDNLVVAFLLEPLRDVVRECRVTVHDGSAWSM